MAATPKYLTGDGAGIKEFIDKFDVSDFIIFILNSPRGGRSHEDVDIPIRL